MATVNPLFGKRIRELREAKLKKDPKFSLRKFADAVGISPTFLSKIERGEFDPPSAENIKKMALLLDVDADELLALAGKVDPALSDIIREQPKAMADFLRTIHEKKLSETDIQEMTDKIRHEKKK